MPPDPQTLEEERTLGRGARMPAVSNAVMHPDCTTCERSQVRRVADVERFERSSRPLALLPGEEGALPEEEGPQRNPPVRPCPHPYDVLELLFVPGVPRIMIHPTCICWLLCRRLDQVLHRTATSYVPMPLSCLRTNVMDRCLIRVCLSTSTNSVQALRAIQVRAYDDRA